jgi:1-acyl-sn-glycerol-3-phosphate acyltransferase
MNKGLLMPTLPLLPDQVPKRQGKFSQKFFKQLYLAQGWQFQGEFPNLAKAVAIVMPHTSNLDGWYGFNFIVAMDLKIHIFAKDSLFKTPLKPLLNWLDVIPVTRNVARGLTQQAIEVINSRDKIWVGMTPEGTRHNAPEFKSGFYRIALGAKVPIVMFALDYAKKIIYCLGAFQPTGNYQADLVQIVALYQNKIVAKHPQRLAQPLQRK